MVGFRAHLNLEYLGIKADLLSHQSKPPDEPGSSAWHTFVHKIQQLFVEHLLVSHSRPDTADVGLNKVRLSALLNSTLW